MRPKPVCKEGEETKEVELEEDTYVSNASIESFPSCLLLGQTKNCNKYLYIGQCDENEVKSCNCKGYKQAINFVDSNISCSQFHNGHVLTVSMGDDSCMIKLKPALY